MVDHAAGVAVLVHLATALKSQPARHPVRFVFFDLEEEDLIGSRYFVSSLQKDSVAAMINLDTLQGGDTLFYGPAAGVEHEQLNRTMRAVCAAADFACVESAAFPDSDDVSFRRGGVPSISLAVLPGNDAHQLWLMLNGGKHAGLEQGLVPEVLQTIHTPADQLRSSIRRRSRLPIAPSPICCAGSTKNSAELRLFPRAHASYRCMRTEETSCALQDPICSRCCCCRCLVSRASRARTTLTSTFQSRAAAASVRCSPAKMPCT